jgi:hypothetical protein
VQILDTPRLIGSNESVGIASARFERSTLPLHEGTRTVLLRILKIITPVKCVTPLYDGHIALPEEGKLHRRFRHRNSTNFSKEPPVWSFDIDKPGDYGLFNSRRGLRAGLRLLWDATDILLSK